MASHPSFAKPGSYGFAVASVKRKISQPARIAANLPQEVNGSNLQSDGGIFLIGNVDLTRCREPIIV